ncbi:MAG TPA: CopD family protein [Nitrospiria bacterium]|nr:CopD family protein [Nitrospiria bacterium]
MLFIWLVLRPALKRPALDSQAQAVLSRVEERFRTVRWASLLTLLGTGLFNLIREGGSARLESNWGGVLMIKLFFVFIVMGATIINDFLVTPTKTSPPSASRSKDWLSGVILFLGLLIIFIGVYLGRM